MNARSWRKPLQVIVWLLAGTASAQLPPPAEENISGWLAAREALYDARKIDVPKLSSAILSAVGESEKLEAQGQYQQALDRLRQLEVFMPLARIPGFNVHMLAGWLHGKLGQPEAAQVHREAASAYRELLWKRAGTGRSTADPLRLVMASEVIDWTKSQLLEVIDLKSMPADGREMMLLTYKGVLTAGRPKSVFIEIDPRTREMDSRSLDRYEPIAVERMREKELQLLALAREKRARFLHDRSFVHGELSQAIDRSWKEAARLFAAGQPAQALAALRALEKHRRIEDIPTPRLLMMYSLLLGQTGDTSRQMDMRGLIFGVQQAIAHSGDALSPATAVHVILIEEEYDWLREKKLKPERQALKEVDGQRYDVMTVRDEQGHEAERYFNVTALFERHADALGGFDSTWRLAEQHNELPDIRRYLREWITGLQTWNDGGVLRRVVWPQEKAITECVTAIFPGPEKVRMVFMVDEQGMVLHSQTDQSGFVDECVKQKTRGMRVPAPGRELMLCTRFEKTGEDRTLTSGCGPAPIVHDCQRKNTTQSCKVYQR